MNAPPRGSGNASQNTDAASPAPTRVAPRSKASVTPSHSGVLTSTERRCIGDPPVRYSHEAPAARSAHSGSIAWARLYTGRTVTESPSGSNARRAASTRAPGFS